jgi:hypothetical protein
LEEIKCENTQASPEAGRKSGGKSTIVVMNF